LDSARLTYSDFQRYLVFRIAVLAGADFERSVYAEDAANHINGRYPASWIATVAVKLKEAGFIDVPQPRQTTTACLQSLIRTSALPKS